MHQSSYDKMQRFRQRYLSDAEHRPLQILDIGSQNVNGCYRPIFDAPAWSYTGLDMCAGDNVDLVVHNPYDWRELASNSMDVVVSGQALEHIEYFWVTMMEISRVMRSDGLCCIIAPSAGVEHRYPVDCWRFYADGFHALGRYVGLEVLVASTQWESEHYTVDDSDIWKDSVLIARKPRLSGWTGLKTRLKQQALRRLAEPRF